MNAQESYPSIGQKQSQSDNLIQTPTAGIEFDAFNFQPPYHSPNPSIATTITSKIERMRLFAGNVRQAWNNSAPQVNAPNMPLSGDIFNNPSMSVIDALEQLPALPPATALLGIAENRQPILINFQQAGVKHLLISGGENAGKTSLLHAIAVSLALQNKQAHVQVMGIAASSETDKHKPSIASLGGFPHLLWPIAEGEKAAAEALSFLVDEVAYRLENQISAPTIVLVVDQLARVLALGGETVSESMHLIAREGAHAGIHIIAATRQPDAPMAASLAQNNFSIQIVGKNSGLHAASPIAGISVQQAKNAGEFTVAIGDTLTHFQAAVIAPDEANQKINQRYADRHKRLIANQLLPPHKEAEPEIAQPAQLPAAPIFLQPAPEQPIGIETKITAPKPIILFADPQDEQADPSKKPVADKSPPKKQADLAAPPQPQTLPELPTFESRQLDKAIDWDWESSQLVEGDVDDDWLDWEDGEMIKAEENHLEKRDVAPPQPAKPQKIRPASAAHGTGLTIPFAAKDEEIALQTPKKKAPHRAWSKAKVEG